MKRTFALALALTLLLAGCGDPAARQTPEPSPTPVVTPTPTPEPTPTPPPPPTVSTLAVCGDAMTHLPITNDALRADGSYDFTHIIAAARPYVEEADYAVCNLETTLSAGNYSGYPNFRAPDALAYGLQESGFDMLLTANNHCMDAGFSGLCRTLDVLDEIGMPHVGTSRTQEEAESDIVVADVGGISVAFLGYTYGTNGIPTAKDAPWSVNLFNTDYTTTMCTPDTERLTSDLAKAKTLGTDLVAVMIHWGLEYHLQQNAYQEKIADLLIANGADLILGGHSHVIQPIEMRTVTTEEGEERTGFVCYSLGNFFSNQNDAETHVTAVLTLELTRDNVTGETSVSDWTYAPMYMSKATLDDGHSRHLLDAYSDPDDKDLLYAIDLCHQVWGPEHDPRAAAVAQDEQ